MSTMRRVIDLQPGEVIRNGSHRAVYLMQTKHPIWAQFQLVAWWVENGPEGGYWSFDALSPGQIVGESILGVDYDAQLRKVLLRQEQGAIQRVRS